MPQELEHSAYQQITTLSAEGNAFADEKKLDAAIDKFEEALSILPKPKEDWEAATWLYASIGDMLFLKKEYNQALNDFMLAMKCPDGYANPFILLRCGQCYLELNDEQNAKEYLLRAYMMEGFDIFKNEDRKYYNFLRENVKL